jgi:hypothetical protein
LLYDGRNISGSGVFDAATGEDILERAATEQGALSPMEVAGMLAVRRGGTPAGRPNISAAPAEKKEAATPPMPQLQEFTAGDLAVLAGTPGELLFPDKASQEVRMVVYIWAEGPSCGRMRDLLQKNREKVGFQVKFVPVVGSAKLERSALSYLGASELPSDEKERLLAALRVATDILGTRTGSIRVPTLAWKERDGSVRLAGLDKEEFGVLLDRLNEEARHE